MAIHAGSGGAHPQHILMSWMISMGGWRDEGRIGGYRAGFSGQVHQVFSVLVVSFRRNWCTCICTHAHTHTHATYTHTNTHILPSKEVVYAHMHTCTHACTMNAHTHITKQ